MPIGTILQLVIIEGWLFIPHKYKERFPLSSEDPLEVILSAADKCGMQAGQMYMHSSVSRAVRRGAQRQGIVRRKSYRL